MKAKTVFILGLLLIAIIMLVAWAAMQQSTPSKLDGFAQCLKDKGAVFYGAFWCPHCQDQKKLFGTAKRLLPYVECSTPNGNGQQQICVDKKIEGYPLWEFADGTRESGLMSLEKLAEKTNCLLPAEQ
jgi:thiol-disulfide isomerase/thioredoxin